MSGNSLTICNTNRELLTYIQLLLTKVNIEVLPLRVRTRTGTTITDPRTGQTYLRKNDCFSFGVRARSLARFQEFIGFTINRKQRRLEISVNRRKPHLLIASKAFQQQEEVQVSRLAGPEGFEPSIFGSRRLKRRSPMSYPGCPRKFATVSVRSRLRSLVAGQSCRNKN
jgi:hypothetical protein